MNEKEAIYKDTMSEEWFFTESTYILSETDEYGHILYANQIFCDIAGYKESELIGEPHNIVRHPDMPRAAFKMLWDDIKAKGFWTGIVKNQRKDGGFYWVRATVLRQIKNGKITYLSIRTKPQRTEVEAAEKLYRTLD